MSNGRWLVSWSVFVLLVLSSQVLKALPADQLRGRLIVDVLSVKVRWRMEVAALAYCEP